MPRKIVRPRVYTTAVNKAIHTFKLARRANPNKVTSQVLDLRTLPKEFLKDRFNVLGNKIRGIKETGPRTLLKKSNLSIERWLIGCALWGEPKLSGKALDLHSVVFMKAVGKKFTTGRDWKKAFDLVPKKEILAPRGLATSFLPVFYELHYLLRTKPFRFERLKIRQPKIYDILTSYFGINRPKKNGVQITKDYQLVFGTVYRHIATGLKAIKLSALAGKKITLDSLRNVSLGSLIEKYGPPPLELHPSMFRVYYPVLQKSKITETSYFKAILKIEKKLLFNYLGIKGKPKTFSQIAMQENISEKAVKSLITKAINKLPLNE